MPALHWYKTDFATKGGEFILRSVSLLKKKKRENTRTKKNEMNLCFSLCAHTRLQKIKETVSIPPNLL